jgi:type V secretory pathway adhesin AidA
MTERSRSRRAPPRARFSGEAMTASISKSERDDLRRLIQQREKVLKSAAKQRSAELLADFENQMGSEFSFDDDEVWQATMRATMIEVEHAKQRIAARCRELGVPARFAPTLEVNWVHRGYDNQVACRKDELRRMAKTKIAAMEAKAMVEVEVTCLKAQTELTATGLASGAARDFFEQLPDIESLMPKLSYAEVAGEAEPPAVEQLISPGALRQRRHRERNRALHDLTSRDDDSDGDGPDGESAR